jgi:uncharacterized protein (TIGR00255 family)
LKRNSCLRSNGMIKSMTGFGRSEYNDGKRNIIVEVKAVNHRYSDISMKMPRRYAFAEDRLKGIVKEVARRGKVEMSIMLENITEEDTNIKLNTTVAKQYADNLMELKNALNLSGDITLQFIATLPDVMKIAPDLEDEEEIFLSLSIPVQAAAKKLDEMRVLEGQQLARDIIIRGKMIRSLLAQIRERAPAMTSAYMEKLRDRMKELIGGHIEISEDRLLMEAAIFADKSSITEELVRLDSHILQLDSIITNSNQPDGKKLDFLVQEMNREANTIGSKANDIEITSLMLEIKSEVEKIREQVQNIE